MANLNIAVVLSGVDSGASSVVSTLTKGLGGLGDIVTGGLAFAFGGLLTDAIHGAEAAMGDFFSSALDAEKTQASLGALIHSVNSSAIEQATQLAKAQTSSITTTALSGDALAKLQDKLTHATAKLDDMTAAYPKLKHPTETQTLALEDQRKKVEALTAQLDAGSQMITRTGGALDAMSGAGTFNIDVVNSLALKYRDLVGGSKETALAIEAIGIRSGAISQDQMPKFIQTVADLAAVTGDASSAATLLARAQEDPVGALGKLQRAGILFSDSLKEQIKTMAKHGDAAGATALIMQRVAEATGGQAAAAMDTLSGRWSIFSEHLKTAGTDIALKVLPGLETLFDQYIAPAIPVVEALASQFADRLGPAMQGLVGFVNMVIGSFQLFGNDVPGAINHILKMLGQFVPGLDTIKTGILTQLKQWAQAFIAWVAPMIPPFLLEVGKLEVQFMTWLAAQIPPLIAQLKLWGQQFIAWVAPFIPPLIAEAQKLAGQLLAWVQAQIPPLVAQLAEWGRQLWAWVAPMIPPLIAEAQKLAGQLMAWLSAQIPPLIAQLLRWGQEFVSWVGPQIPPLLAELGKLLGQLSGWAWGTALPEIIKQVARWAVAFMDWVMKPGGAKDQILPALGSFLLAVGKFVDTDLVPGFIGFAKSFIDGLLSGFNTNLPTLISNVEGVGKSIITGIVSGIQAAPGAIFAALKSIVDNAIAGIIAGLTGGGGGGGGGGDGGGGGGPGHRAGGGPVSAFMPYWVGEQGPELFVPASSGAIVPNAQTARGGDTYVVYYTGAATDERTLVQDLSLWTRMRSST